MCPGRYGAVYRQQINKDNTQLIHNEDCIQKSSISNKNKTEHIVQYMKWGLIPSFSKEQKMMGSTFNCRDDNLKNNSKSIWSGIKQTQRCFVLAEGYYEWKKNKNDNGRGVPYYVCRKDRKLICFAGLWDFNDKGDDGIYSFTIITTHAARGMEWLHERMPVMVSQDSQGYQVGAQSMTELWLNPQIKWNDNSLELSTVLVPYDLSNLEIYQVSSDIGSIYNNNPGLNKPLKGTIGSYFAQIKQDPQDTHSKKAGGEGDMKEIDNNNSKRKHNTKVLDQVTGTRGKASTKATNYKHKDNQVLSEKHDSEESSSNINKRVKTENKSNTTGNAKWQATKSQTKRSHIMHAPKPTENSVNKKITSFFKPSKSL